MSRVGICIVNWNGVHLLPDCLASIRAQTMTDHCTIVVDNDSKDGSVDWLRSEHPDVDVIPLDWNSGFAHANNVAMRRAFEDPACEYVVLLNTDARLAPDWLEVVVAEADRKPRGAMFQSLTLDWSDPSVIDSHHIYVARNLQATQAGNRERPRPRARHRAGLRGERRRLPVLASVPRGPAVRRLPRRAARHVPRRRRPRSPRRRDGLGVVVRRGTHALHMGSASSKARASDFSLYMTWRNQPGMLLANFPGRILLRALPSALKADVQTILHLPPHG